MIMSLSVSNGGIANKSWGQNKSMPNIPKGRYMPLIYRLHHSMKSIAYLKTHTINFTKIVTKKKKGEKKREGDDLW